jgi:hypothetical protein
MVASWLGRKRVDIVWFDPEEYPAHRRISYRLRGQDGDGPGTGMEADGLDWDVIRSALYRTPQSPKASDRVLDPNLRSWIQKEAATCLSGLWSAAPWFWVSHPQRIIEGQYKPCHLRRAVELGFTIPRTLISNDPDQILSFVDSCGGCVISKPLLHGTLQRGEKRYAIYTRMLRPPDVARLRRTAFAPVIFQEYVPKWLELRVTVVGDRCFAAAIHSQQSPRSRVDWRRYDFEHTPYVPYRLPQDVRELCIALVRDLGLQYGALDLILRPDGSFVFLEINPVGQWGWVEFLTGLPISRALADLLTSARARIQ